MENEFKVINIDIHRITTPKVKYFIFWESPGKRLDISFEPFKLKEPVVEFPYPFHMYGDDLLIWRKFSEGIVPYSNRYTATSWEDAMKYEMFLAISNGKLDKIATHKQTSEKIQVKFNWVGEKVPKAGINYK